VASDFDRTFLGLPEVRLGILPGFGGSTRLPRLIGLPAALDLILTGKTVDAARAFKLALVDDVLPKEDFVARAVRWLHLRLDMAAFERTRAERGAAARPPAWALESARPRVRVRAGAERAQGNARHYRAAQGAQSPRHGANSEALAIEAQAVANCSSRPSTDSRASSSSPNRRKRILPTPRALDVRCGRLVPA
jgi:enoyl-CoA hydratase/carnithine racemase